MDIGSEPVLRADPDVRKTSVSLNLHIYKMGTENHIPPWVFVKVK